MNNATIKLCIHFLITELYNVLSLIVCITFFIVLIIKDTQ